MNEPELVNVGMFTFAEGIEHKTGGLDKCMEITPLSGMLKLWGPLLHVYR